MQTFRKLDLVSLFTTNIMFDEVNLSVNLSREDLINLTSNRKAKVKYIYNDVDIEKKRSEQKTIFFNDEIQIDDDMRIEYIKFNIKNMLLTKENFISQLQSIIWYIIRGYGEKCCMYLFKKYNKILEINADTSDNTSLILDHQIDKIFNTCYKASIIVNKHLLRRDLYYDEYMLLIAHKINTNIDMLCEDDIIFFKDLLFGNPDDVNDHSLYILDKIINHFYDSSMCTSNIIDIVKSEFIINKVIASRNTEIIINIIKFATTILSIDIILIYNKYIDYNNMDIEKYFNYRDLSPHYNFFDSLLAHNIYEIKLDKICERCSYSLTILLYFVKAYYQLDDIDTINIADYNLPTQLIYNIVINVMKKGSSNCFASNINFIKYNFPDILLTDSPTLSCYYERLCWLVADNHTRDEYYSYNDSLSIDKKTIANYKEVYCRIKEEIDNNINCGLISYDKIIADIIMANDFDVLYGLNAVLKSLENILGKQYLTRDNFDSLFMNVMNDINFISKPDKIRMKYFCDIINNFLPPQSQYCELDLYKNHYYSYLLNFAIDYIAIDGDYIILPGTNINLHIDNFKFYPFFALVRTDNSHIVSHIIDNYKLADSSAIQLIIYLSNFYDSNFFITKLIKKYLDVLKSHQQNESDASDITGINFSNVENICDIIIE